MDNNTIAKEVIETVTEETAKNGKFGAGEWALTGMVFLGVWKAGELLYSGSKWAKNKITNLVSKKDKQKIQTVDLTDAKEVQDEPEK